MGNSNRHHRHCHEPAYGPQPGAYGQYPPQNVYVYREQQRQNNSGCCLPLAVCFGLCCGCCMGECCDDC
ncbi:hypothetical protein Ddc_15812 [Ditylenchus destructor]|nr:hypothetical protein Ddc_15812 [Ditylenchus destructor]